MDYSFPVFIIGMPRSGTTLLSNMLNASKAIYFGTETHVFSEFHKWKSDQINNNFSSYYFSKDNPFLKYFDFEEVDFLRLKKISNNMNPSQILQLICSFEAEKRNITRWGEKTPNHAEHLEEIFYYFPNAKIINVVRDPRDVYMSILKAGWKKRSSNPYYFCKRYKDTFSFVNSYEDDDRLMTVKYENLISNSKETLFNICTFINIPFNENFIFNFNNDDNHNYKVSLEPWKGNNGRSLIINNFNKWKKDSSNKFLYKYISNVLKYEILYFNYENNFNFSKILSLIYSFKFKFRWYFYSFIKKY